MKRLLPLLPLTLFLLLNACASGTAQAESDMWALFNQTMTATQWTSTPTQFYNLNVTNILNILNADLPVANPLEWMLDAEYFVTNVKFQNVPEIPGTVLIVDVRCLCRNSAECCIPERTFVVIIGSMKRNANAILAQVPNGVSQLLVACYDYQTLEGAVSATWDDVRGYLLENLTGHQLGVRVSRTTIP